MLGVRIAKRKIEPQKPANPCGTRLCSCIFSVNTRQKSPEISTVSGLLLFSVYLQRAFLCLICVLQSKKCVSAGKKAGQDQHLTGFSFCRCFSCRSALFLLVRHNNVGELLCDLRRLFIRRRDDMRVNIGGRAHLSMSQAAGDYDERRSLCNQQGSVRMPEAVHMDLRESVPPRKIPKPA